MNERSFIIRGVVKGEHLMAGVAISMKNPGFNYGRLRVIDELSLDIPTGINFGLFWPVSGMPVGLLLLASLTLRRGSVA